MIYRVKPGQVSYGEPIGILLAESYAPYIPGDVANATTYPFPVRFQRVPGLRLERIFNRDMDMLERITEAALELKREGVRAISSNCGYMAVYQGELARRVGIPVFLSSLMQLSFLQRLLAPDDKIGVIAARGQLLDRELLRACGLNDEALWDRLVVGDLEACSHFRSAYLAEDGWVDTEVLEAELVGVAKDLVEKEPRVKMILLECAVLPPYGKAVQEATGLPVFDFVTMIEYVYSGVVRRAFAGFM